MALVGLVAAILAIAGVGPFDSENEPAAVAPQGQAATEACAEVEAPEPKQVDLKRPKLDPPPAGTVATVETSCGEFEIELDSERAPKTSASFAHMVEEGVYDGTTFHRVAPQFVIQGGDPQGNGTGDAGYSVDEEPPQSLSYTEGTVAMAKTGAEPPGRSGSQFFVVTAADAGLPPDYALLGEVVSGEAVVKRIEELGDPATQSPTRPVVIETITLNRPE